MTWDGIEERRRGPRIALGEQVDCRFELRSKVRLLDISATGALLATDEALPVHTPGRLRAVLAATRFAPQLEVRRTTPLPGNEGIHLGAVFVGMDEESRKGLEAFLKKATT